MYSVSIPLEQGLRLSLERLTFHVYGLFRQHSIRTRIKTLLGIRGCQSLQFRQHSIRTRIKTP